MPEPSQPIRDTPVDPPAPSVGAKWLPEDFADEVAALRAAPGHWSIIGGMATIIWATQLLSVEEVLATGSPFPLYSKDLDVRGGAAHAAAIEALWGRRPLRWKFKEDGRDLWAVSTDHPLGDPRRRTVEVTARVVGLAPGEGLAVPLAHRGVSMRVLDPVSCLRAKADVLSRTPERNAAGERKDHIHVRLLQLVVPRYLTERERRGLKVPSPETERARAEAALREAGAALDAYAVAAAMRTQPVPTPAAPIAKPKPPRARI